MHRRSGDCFLGLSLWCALTWMTHDSVQVKEIHEEEWSYIPVGGPLPLPDQPITAFGAAANLVHPATGETGDGSRGTACAKLLKQSFRG